MKTAIGQYGFLEEIGLKEGSKKSCPTLVCAFAVALAGLLLVQGALTVGGLLLGRAADLASAQADAALVRALGPLGVHDGASPRGRLVLGAVLIEAVRRVVRHARALRARHDLVVDQAVALFDPDARRARLLGKALRPFRPR